MLFFKTLVSSHKLRVTTPADGRIDVGPLMTHTFPSTEFPAAYANASNYEDDVIKTLVVCE